MECPECGFEQPDQTTECLRWDHTFAALAHYLGKGVILCALAWGGFILFKQYQNLNLRDWPIGIASAFLKTFVRFAIDRYPWAELRYRYLRKSGCRTGQSAATHRTSPLRSI